MKAVSTDGRNIDLRIGTLSGEGSQQEVTSESEPSLGVSPHYGSATPEDPAYYDRPVIKKSPWAWDIPAYYYVGGATGGSMVLGAAATLLNRDGLPGIVRWSRWIGTVGGSISAVLLIHDLGRPSRFLHMLRVFRPTSPMSVGSWILVSFSTLAGLSAIGEWLPRRRLRMLGDVAAVAGGVFGLGLAGYTGVLVSNTAVPVWQRPHRLMPVLFLASGSASAASLFEIIGGNRAEERCASVFGIAGKVTEITTAMLLERDVATVPEAARPLREGFSGTLWQAGKILSTGGLLLSLIAGRSATLRRAAGVLGTAGAICVRFGIHYAGQRSAMNPRATFHQQRKGQGAFEITGQSAITGPGEIRAVGVPVSST